MVVSSPKISALVSLFCLIVAVLSAPTHMTEESCARISSCDECVRMKCHYMDGNPGHCIESRSTDSIRLASTLGDCAGIQARARNITLESRTNAQQPFTVNEADVDQMWNKMASHVLDGETKESKDRNGRHLASTWLPKHVYKSDPPLIIESETSLAIAKYLDGTREKTKGLWLDEPVMGILDGKPTTELFHGRYTRDSVARICKDAIKASLTARKSTTLERRTVCYSVDSWTGGPNICIAVTDETCHPAPSITKTTVPAGHVCPCFAKS